MQRVRVPFLDSQRRPNTTCQICQSAMYRRPSKLQAGAGRYCSRACRNKAHPATGPCPSKGHKGARNAAWKGGITFKRNKGNYIGPKYVRCPATYLAMARKDGYIMEHRLVMAQVCDRILDRVEVVHHRDHNTRNNTPINLELWPDNRSHKAFEHSRIVIGAACRLRIFSQGTDMDGKL